MKALKVRDDVFVSEDRKFDATAYSGPGVYLNPSESIRLAIVYRVGSGPELVLCLTDLDSLEVIDVPDAKVEPAVVRADTGPTAPRSTTPDLFANLAEALVKERGELVSGVSFTWNDLSDYSQMKLSVDAVRVDLTKRR